MHNENFAPLKQVGEIMKSYSDIDFRVETGISMANIDNHRFPVYKMEIPGFNIIEVTAGTNGYQGGDSGHGSRTYIRIEDTSCTDIRVKKIEGDYTNGGVEIILGGDNELSSIIDGLEFIVNVLKIQSKKEHKQEG